MSLPGRPAAFKIRHIVQDIEINFLLPEVSILCTSPGGDQNQGPFLVYTVCLLLLLSETVVQTLRTYIFPRIYM